MADRPIKRNETLRLAWFAAASEILAAEGYGTLKLAALCNRLGVTTGSFYHSFDNWQDFTDALLADWLEDRVVRIVGIARETEDPVLRLDQLAQAASELEHRTEGAIRVWAGVDDRVAKVQQAVDEGRYQVVYEAMESIVGREQAPAYTAWGLSTLVGFEVLAGVQDPEHVLWSLRRILADAERERRRQGRDA